MTTTVQTSRGFDALDKRRFIRLIQKGHAKPAAAEKVGFTWATVKRHLKADPDFAEAVREAEDEILDAVAHVPVQKALDGNLAAAIFVLTNRRPHEWRDTKTIRTEISGPGGGPIELRQAVTVALKDVLSGEDTRADALRFARSIPVASRAVGPATEDGDAVALPRGVGGGDGARPAGAQAPRPSE